MRWIKRILLAVACLLGIVVVSGASFEAVMRHRAARDFPAPGRLVDVGGRRLQIDCRGAGSPTVVLESGGPTNVWKEEQIDPSAEFRAHFEGDVPDFVGVGLMSDGDQTLSISAADYTGFVLVH